MLARGFEVASASGRQRVLERMRYVENVYCCHLYVVRGLCLSGAIYVGTLCGSWYANPNPKYTYVLFILLFCQFNLLSEEMGVINGYGKKR